MTIEDDAFAIFQKELDAAAAEQFGRFKKKIANGLIQPPKPGGGQRMIGRSLTDVTADIIKLRGGPTSGNFGHKSVKGKRGGSKPGGGHRSIGVSAGASKKEVKKTISQHRRKAAGGGSSFAEALEGIADEAIAKKKERQQGIGKGQAVTPSGGKKMSESLDLRKVPKKGKTREAIDDTLAAIDSVHGDGALDSGVPMAISKSSSIHGEYVHQSLVSRQVRLSSRGDHPRMTMAHEMGHMLDHKGLRESFGGSTFGSDNRSQSPQMQKLQGALNDSAAVKSLKHVKNSKGVIVDVKTSGGIAKMRHKSDSKYVDYLIRPKEIFARSYAQYIATRSGDRTMLRELDSLRKPKSGRINYQQQWSNKDFEPIAAAYDELLAAEGYRQ